MCRFVCNWQKKVQEFEDPYLYKLERNAKSIQGQDRVDFIRQWNQEVHKANFDQICGKFIFQV